MPWRYSPETPLHPLIMKLIFKLYGSNKDFNKRFNGATTDGTSRPVESPLSARLAEASMPTWKQREGRGT